MDDNKQDNTNAIAFFAVITMIALNTYIFYISF